MGRGRLLLFCIWCKTYDSADRCADRIGLHPAHEHDILPLPHKGSSNFDRRCHGWFWHSAYEHHRKSDLQSGGRTLPELRSGQGAVALYLFWSFYLRSLCPPVTQEGTVRYTLCDYGLRYPHLEQTPFSFSEIPQSGQQSASRWGS